MKILAVCNKGNVRSVATKYCLNRRGYWDVLTVGSSVVSGDTFDMLCGWADLILLAKPRHGRNIKPKFKKKVDKYFTIGDDRWGMPLNLELEEIINKKLDELCL